jgi:hypothetical protein
MSSTRTRIAASLAAAAGVAALAAAPASAAPADGRCQAAGIATLKTLGPLSSFVQNGVPVAAAVANGVTVRPGMEDVAATLPAVLPFQVVLADHRAGDDSIFIYPWCS